MTTYPKNFISKVIARVDFQPILKLKQEEPVEFQEAIRPQFPRYLQSESIDISLKPGEQPSATKKPITYQFLNNDKTGKIDINFRFITFSSEKYVSFETFFPNIELMFNTFNNIYNPGIITRVGLRFINEIKLKGNPFDWDGYLNNNLYCMLNAFPELSNSLTRAMSQMHINLGDRTISFQFGIWNSEFPNSIAQKEFILDYDCVSREECNSESVLSKFKIFYEDIKNLFKQCRREKLIATMKGESV